MTRDIVRINSVKWFVSIGIIVLVFMFAPLAHASETKEPGALTLPPPKTEATRSIQLVNPNNTYLFEAQIYNFGFSASKARINVLTSAYTVVDRVGADVSLQRWSGADWVTVHNSNLSARINRSYLGVAEWDAVPGYYYRVTSVHFANHGSVREEFTNTSASILYPKN